MEIQTLENGEIECQIAPIGSFNGSDSKGQPVPEHITAENLESLAEKLNQGDEVLCDIDHASCRPGVERDTQSAGWFSRFFVKPLKGLFGILKLTKKGKELIENREYRYLSPVFNLDKDGNPVDMHSVALTNLPAFKGSIKPILNTEPENGDILNMTKEDLVELIKETITALNAAPVEEQTEVVNSEPEKPAEEKPAEEKPVEESKADVVEETPVAEVENSCGKEEKKEEMKNEEPATEAPVVVEEPKKEEPVKKEPEVIKVEALNSMPAASQYDVVENAPAWKNMHGKEFFNWLQKHPKGI